MQAITQFNVHPDELIERLLARIQQPATSIQNAIPVEQLPDQSAKQAADYLGCSESHLTKLVGKYPEHLRPVVEKGKATRYRMAELYYLKSNNLVK